MIRKLFKKFFKNTKFNRKLENYLIELKKYLEECGADELSVAAILDITEEKIINRKFRMILGYSTLSFILFYILFYVSFIL